MNFQLQHISIHHTVTISMLLYYVIILLTKDNSHIYLQSIICFSTNIHTSVKSETYYAKSVIFFLTMLRCLLVL